jgi:hypothetical protein
MSGPEPRQILRTPRLIRRKNVAAHQNNSSRAQPSYIHGAYRNRIGRITLDGSEGGFLTFMLYHASEER